MKTAKNLLLRDALAKTFVEAAMGSATEAAHVRALARLGPDAPQPALAALCAEDGAALFGRDGALAPAFAALEPYVLDRARRFAAALAWLEQDDTIGVPLEVARAAWDAGLFFEVHEVLEPVWLKSEGARKEQLQGLIMAAVAIHHLIGGNLAGAGTLLGKAAERLTRRPETEPNERAVALDPDALADFAARIGAIGEGVRAGRIASPADVDDLPRF